MNIFLFFSIILFVNTKAFAKRTFADDLVVSISDATGCLGDTICVEMTVGNFLNIEGFEIGLTFDPSILEYLSFDASVLTQVMYNDATTSSTGWIFLLWTDPLAVSTTLSDDTVIGTFCFVIKGDPGSSAQVNILPSSYYVSVENGDRSIDYIPNTIFVTSCNEYEIVLDWCSPTPGNSDGTLSVSACCGSAPYTFTIPSIGGGGLFADADVHDFSNIGPGTYTVTMLDASSNSKLLTFTIDEQDAIVGSFVTIKNPTCWNKSNGRLEVSNVVGGVPPYKLAWSTGQYEINVNSVDTYRIEELSSGNYDVTISDATGCELVLFESLYTDTITATATLIDSATCYGVNDGVILIVGSGGIKDNGGYHFNGDIASPVMLTKSDTVKAGWNEYWVSGDPVNCTSVIDSIFVPVKKVLHVELIEFKEELDCYSDLQDVKIELVGVDKIGPPSGFSQLGTQLLGGGYYSNVLTQDEIGEGVYDVFLTEQGTGCRVDTTLVITAPDSLYITSNDSPPSCIGNNGSIDITVIGGTPSYTYTWSDGPSTSPSRTGLGSGIYKVTVFDDKGCQVEETFDFEDGIALDISIDTIQLIECNDANSGSLKAVVHTSGSSFDFEWSNASGVIASTDVISNLSADTYYLKITDTSDGCTAYDTLTLLAVGNMVVDTILTIPTCSNSKDGAIGITITGGTGSYQIDWKDYPLSEDLQLLSAIAPGSYEVTVSDQGSCSVVVNVNLPGPDPILVSIDNLTSTSCFGDNDGKAKATGINGTNGPDYSFIWSSSPDDGNVNVSSDIATHLFGGTQWVYAFDGNCATDTFFFEVPQPDELLVDSLGIIDPSCAGSCDGILSVKVKGGIPNYQYQWGIGALDKSISGLCEGVYSVTVMDNTGCTLDTIISIVEPVPFVVSIDSAGIKEISCNDDNGSIAVKYEGGNLGDVNYYWTGNVSDMSTATDLPAGTYEITAIDSRGCLDTTSYTLATAEPIVATIAGFEEVPCYGETTCISIESVVGGVGNYTFSINNSPNYAIDSCVEVVAGEYDILVFDNAGCFDTAFINIPQPNETILSITPIDPVFDLGQEPMELNLSVTNNVAATDTIIWTPTDALDCVFDDCSQVMISPLEDIIYQVTLVDDNGCTAKTSVTITVRNNRNVYFPNIFNPNADDENSLFSFDLGPGVEQLKYLQIFDRWGNQIYSAKNIFPGSEDTAAWDGTYKGQLVEPGVYVYTASVSFIDGRTIPYKGSMTVIR